MLLFLASTAFAQDLEITFEVFGQSPVTHPVSIADGVVFDEVVPTGRRTHLEVVVEASRDGEQLHYDCEIVEVTRRLRGEQRQVVSRPRVTTGGLDKAATISQGAIDGQGEQVGGFTLTITPI